MTFLALLVNIVEPRPVQFIPSDEYAIVFVPPPTATYLLSIDGPNVYCCSLLGKLSIDAANLLISIIDVLFLSKIKVFFFRVLSFTS